MMAVAGLARHLPLVQRSASKSRFSDSETFPGSFGEATPNGMNDLDNWRSNEQIR